MTRPSDPYATLIQSWPAAAQAHFEVLRATIQNAAEAARVGPVTESLKWGQPAWRPTAPRTGSTLRLTWSPKAPDAMMVYVDCKTDLAARMADLYPALQNDGRRAIALALDTPPPLKAIAHLATMTFTYHRH